jgi:osmotically-inducible protein OsmY
MKANGELHSGPRVNPDSERMAESSDAKIAGAVTILLAWSAELDAQHVRAHVENGLVTLEGSVARPTERRAAERLARQIRGVCGVSNRIQVAGKPQMPPPTATVGYGHSAGWLPVDEEC